MECNDIHVQFKNIGGWEQLLMEEMHILNFSSL